jgi:hypothetical protein
LNARNAIVIRATPGQLVRAEKFIRDIVIDNVNDLFSIPLLFECNPAAISVEEVRLGGFLQAGDQANAIVRQADKCRYLKRAWSGVDKMRNLGILPGQTASLTIKEHGQTIISAARQANTAGTRGTGTVMGIVIKALAPGASTRSIVQVNARDSQQRPIQLATGESSAQVKP